LCFSTEKGDIVIKGAGIPLVGFYAGSIPWVKNAFYALAVFFITAS
jgi:hypothetical protein